jgi:hypothetical protein
VFLALTKSDPALILEEPFELRKDAGRDDQPVHVSFVMFLEEYHQM